MYILIADREVLAFPNLKTLLVEMNAALGDAKVSLDGPYRLQVRNPGQTLRVIRLAPFVEALSTEGTTVFSLPLLSQSVPVSGSE